MMLKSMRANTKIIMIIVIIGFVGMIVVGWGMDITDRRSGSQTGIIGKINGEKITYEVYNSYLQTRRESLGDRQAVNYTTIRQLHSEIWNEIVNQTIMAQEIKKRKITYSNQELLNYILNNPHQGLFQLPLFQEDGRFSFSKYQGFVRNPDNFNNPQTAGLLNFIEAQAKSTLPFLKFQQTLTGAIVVPESNVRDRWHQENERRTIRWSLVSVSRFSDAIREVDQKELEDYYYKHKEEFKKEEHRALDMVFFPLAATAQDSADVIERAEMLSQRAKSGEDFADLANGYSEDPGNDDRMGNRRGGDLGYFGRNNMVKPFEDVAFSMKPGEISDPFLSPFGYHVVKVDSIKYKDDSKKEIDQVKARHILLKLEPSSRTREALEERVNAYYDKTVEGSDFAVLAKDEGIDISRTAQFTVESTFIGSIGQNSQMLVQRSFKGETGDILPVYWIDQGALVLQIAEVNKAGIPLLEDVIAQVRQAVREEKGRVRAEEFAGKVDQLMISGMSLEEAAVADSSNMIAVKTDTVTRTQNIRGLGAKSPLIAAVFKLKEKGDSTGPVSIDQGVSIAVVDDIEPLDSSRFENDKDRLREQMIREVQDKIITRVMENLRENAEIVDNRYQIYTNL